MSTIALEELKKLPYLDMSALDGRTVNGRIFDTERGFCIDPKTHPFNTFENWQPEHYYNETLASVLPWIADTILKTIDACNSLMSAFGTVVRLSPAIAPGYAVFVRGYHNEAFTELLSIHSGGPVWWDKPIMDEMASQLK